MIDDTQEPWTPVQLLDWLDSLGIDCPTIHHPPLRTVADSRKHREIHEGAYTKNLFVRNKKGRMWLLTLLEHRSVQLKATARQLGAGNFSFASQERLMQYLGIVPGAVSPLALVNDPTARVEFVLDTGVLEYDRVHMHPLDNSMTTTLRRDDFLKFLDAVDHPPLRLELDD
ncbi:MAG: prolyl-tRNA synthetase associated domain-containing protein [Proteobacteria bacterium]|nr:MAG: prolyl-tRNA synthetase associated domain-containing protein [Pseudomonadota bacterium]